MSEAAMIICRAQADLGSQWLTVVGAPGAWRIDAASNHLESVVSSLKLKEELARDFTFTTRAIEDAQASYAAEPDDLARLGLNSLATIFCPEGGGVQNKWTALHRVPVTAALVGTGVDGKFRPQLLKERVVEWFVKQQWRSFAPQKVSERHEPVHQQAHRPAHHRELLIRQNWAAREIAPEAFGPLNLGPVVTDEMAARRISRMPQSKSAARRAKHQQNAERFKAEAEERARLRGEVA